MPFDNPGCRSYPAHPFFAATAYITLSDMPTTEVILTEKIHNLGAEADIVKVKVGYARNFLIPNGKALEITPAALRRINILKGKRAEREAQELNEAQDLARKINKVKLDLELETGETGKAFGSITAADISEKLKGALGGNIEIDRHRIHLERPIKETGKHEVEIKLHHDVTAKLEITVNAKGAPAAEKPAEEEKADKGPGGYKAKAKAKHKSKE
jgi:large subunit ribosomal protein L9